jgi:Flp pilus assembly protein TadD
MAKQKTEQRKLEEKKITAFSLNSEKGYMLLIFAFSFLLYFNSVFNDYNLDDELVTQNHRLTSKGISAIPEIFSSPYYQDNAGYKYEYRPLVLVSFAIEHTFFGEKPGTSHLINVLLYCLLCLLLFKVLKLLLQGYNLIWPLLITLLFAAHPIHTEVVASIKNRDEILSLGFSLLAMYFALRFAIQKNAVFIVAVFCFFLLGILSKPTAVVFAILIPLTLVMLTQLSFTRLMLVSTLLVLPAVFFARLYSVNQQIILGLGLLIVIAGLYALRHLPDVREKFKLFLNGLKTIAIPYKKSGTEESETLDFSFLKRVPLAVLFLTLLFILPAVSLFGIYSSVNWMAIAPLLLLAVLFLSVKPAAKLLLVTPITIVALYALLKFNLNASPLEASLLVFLAAIILNSNKTFKVVGLLNYAAYAVLTGFFNHSFFSIGALAFIVLLNKRTYALAYVALAAFLAFYGKALYSIFHQHSAIELSIISVPITIAALILAIKDKARWLGFAVALLPVFVLAAFLTARPLQQFSLKQSVKDSYYNLNAIKAADPVPVKSVRPLVFMETPISSSDPLSLRVGTAMDVLGKYFRLIFLPYPLSYYYGYAYISPVNITASIPMFWLVVHILLTGIAFFFIRRQPVLSFSVFFYLASIAAFSTLAIPIPGMMGDRFLLVPSIGFCIFLGFILSKLTAQSMEDKIPDLAALKLPFRISVITVLALYSVVTIARNSDWKDRVTLFSHDINAVENSAQAQNLLALHLFLSSSNEPDAVAKKQMRENALLHFNRAIEIYPRFLNAAFDKGRLLESMGKFDEALEAYLVATKIDTNFKTPYFSMGVIYQNRKRDAEAAACYEKFLQSYPQQMQTYANLSFAYFRLQQYDRSIATNRRAMAINPTAFDPVVNIAITYKQIGQLDSALFYYEKARPLKPDYPGIDNTIMELKNRR